MSNQQPVYQVSRLTPGVIQVMVQDDSPDVVAGKFFQFFGIDLPIAYLHDYDFNNVLTFVDKAFQNIIQKHPIEIWNSITIQEAQSKQVYLGKRCLGCKTITQDQDQEACGSCKEKDQKGFEDIFKEEISVKKEWDVIQLWEAVIAKVYIKMTRSRQGFTLKSLTEDKSHIRQDITQPTVQNPMQEQPQQQKKDGGWKIF